MSPVPGSTSSPPSEVGLDRSSSVGPVNGPDDPCLAGDAYCPFFQHAVEVVGRRWTASILRQLHFGVGRFGEIRAAIPGLSDRLLDTRLRELVEEGIVERADDGGYRLTAKGSALAPVMNALTEWASSFADVAPTPVPGRIRAD